MYDHLRQLSDKRYYDPKAQWGRLLLDTMVALLAGLVIFPAVFAFGVEAGAGPGLTFVTLPSVFSQMPGGPIWSSLFFLLLFIAALTSAISLLEVVSAYFIDEMGWGRPKAMANGSGNFHTGHPFLYITCGQLEDCRQRLS